MKNKPNLDVKKIAKALGAEHRGKVSARSGYFGAVQLVAEIQSRFRVPAGGGRPTDPEWTERRLVRLAPKTLTKLERLAHDLQEEGVAVEPLQLAAFLLEASVEGAVAEQLARHKKAV